MMNPIPARKIIAFMIAAAGWVSGVQDSYGQSPAESKIYWLKEGFSTMDLTSHRSIAWANLDGSNDKTLVTPRGVGIPEGLAVDEGGGQIYWTDAGMGRIQRANLDGTNVETLLTELAVQGLAVDAIRDQMYWTEPSTGRIQRANLDGTNVETLLTELEQPGNIVLEVDGSQIYWIELDPGRIQRANLDGTNVETLLALLENPVDLAVDADGDQIYWVEGELWNNCAVLEDFCGPWERSDGRMRRADLDGTNVETLRPKEIRAPKGIALDTNGGKIYWTDYWYIGGWPTWVASENLSFAGTIRWADLDGDNTEVLLPPPSTWGPSNIVLDVDGGQIYWIDTGTIHRADFDGTNSETLLTGLGRLVDLAVDAEDGRIYWAAFEGSIHRANLDGTDAEILLSLRPKDRGRRPRSIALDGDEGKIYWTEFAQLRDGTRLGTGSIHRADFDGTNIETLVPRLKEPWGIALDGNEKKIYWTEFAVGDNNRWETGSIQRANFDGTNIETLVTQLDEPRDIVLDIIGGKIYWEEQSYDELAGVNLSYLYRTDLNGSDIEYIFHLSRWGSAIALGGSTPPPQPTALPTTILYGHTALVLSVAFAPNGEILASGSYDATIRLWDAHTGELKNTLEGHNTWAILSVAFSPDGGILASGSYDATIRLWDAHTGELENTLEGHTAGVPSVAFSPDGDILASGSEDGTIRLWNADTGELKNTLEGHSRWAILSVAFSPDGNTLASGNKDGTVWLWDVGSGELKNTLKGHTAEIYSVAFAPDGKTLASGSQDEMVRLWDVDTSQPQAALFGHTAAVHSVAFSPDGNTLASGSADATIWLWDADTRELKNTLEGHTAWVYSMAFSPDGLTLASGDYEGTIRLWDMSPYITLSTPTAIELSPPLPTQTALLANFPNPFNPDTYIPYQLHAPAQVRLSIYDVRGALVREIDLGYRAAGQYLTSTSAVHWDGRNQGGQHVASGVYLYRLQAGLVAHVRKMVVVK
ncbi:MAG: hypothetical protein OXI58_09240 [Gemmatimonadota bacterium]|nr:hypothetical protein [Gemmatimonadota bacterium]